MKNIIIAFLAGLMAVTFPWVLKAYHEAKVDSYTQTFSLVATPATVTSANVSLGIALYGNNLVNVIQCSSNVTGDSPTASAYNSVSKVLTISGLLDNESRTLAIEYDVASEAYADVPIMSGILLFFIYAYILGMLALLGGAIWNIFRR